MSKTRWQERWQRYRRYGLEPLPADASDEVRKARLAELKQLRKQRQRKYILRSGILTLALTAAGGASLWWLVNTLAGRDFLLAQIKARLPANTTFEWQSADGPVNGPLTLHGVRFSWTACADDDFDVNTTAMSLCKDTRTSEFHASRVMLHPQLGALLGRRLRLRALEVDGAALALVSADDTPFELPTWPEVLPRIEPPLAIEVDAVRVNDLKVLNDGEHSIDIHRLNGSLLAESGRLDVRQLQLDSDKGQFQVHGYYAPGKHFQTDLTATAVFPAATGQTRGRIGLIARGNLENMQVFIGGRTPAPLRATLNLRADSARAAEQGKTTWTLAAHSEGFDPAIFSSGRSDNLMQFKLDAKGEGGKADVQGEWSQGEQHIVLQPSTLRLENQTLHAEPLQLEVLGGQLVVQGRGQFTGERAAFDFAAQARQLVWADASGQTQIRADGDFNIQGTQQDWRVGGTALLARDKQKADVQLDGQGDETGLTLKTLAVVMPEGRLDAAGRVDFAPALKWHIDAALAGFDPGYFVPDFPGAVRGKITSQGQMQANEQLHADIKLSELGGQLRNRALSGQANMAIRGDDYSGDWALALGSSRTDGKARYGQNLEVDARFAPLQLNDLLPSAKGLLNGEVKLSGTPSAPNIQASLSGQALSFGDYRAASLNLRGQLPWQGSGGDLRIQARELQLGVALDTLEAHARGAVENLALDARATGELGRINLAATANKHSQGWRGGLATLDFSPARGAAWRLQNPLTYAQNGNRFSLSQGCFVSSAGGSLCAGGQWPGSGIHVEGRALPLLLATPYLPEREDGKPWVLDGILNLDADFAPRGNAWAGTAQIRSERGALKLGQRDSDELMRYQNLRLNAELGAQQFKAQLDTGISRDGRMQAEISSGWDEFAPLAGRVDVDMRDLGWLEVFAPDIVDPVGTLTGTLTLSGTRAEPMIGGDAELAGLQAEVPAYGLVLRNGKVTMRAQPDGNARLSGSIQSGDGVLNLDGTLGWQGQDTPIMLNIRGQNVLLSDTRDLRAVVNPDVTVKIQGNEPMDVSGTVSIPSARMDLERLSDGVSASPDVVVLDPTNPARSRSSLLLDLTLAIGDDVQLRGFGLDGTLGGNLRVRARPGSEMRGTGELSVEGKYAAYGQKLDIDQGKLRWSNDPVSNPIVDLRARRVIGDVSAGIRVTGRVSAPQAEIWSSPQMDQSEALAYLALGRSLSTASSAEGKQINAASAALSAGSTFLASQIATRIGFDDAGVIQSNTLGGSVFGVGKYLSPRVYVSYGVSLLGTGQVLTLKYMLRRGFDISIESSTVENKGSVNWRKEK
ncbi:pathogenicity protein [Lysobacteraceae bacterium NML95-0200]|nr:pathogenicity protein [Xanthomonadaceae bacterium NML95-0200]